MNTGTRKHPKAAGPGYRSKAKRGYRGRSDAHPLDLARHRAVIGVKSEGRFLAIPAGQTGFHGVEMARCNIDEGRGAGAAVEVFIGAADGEIRIRTAHIDRHRACRMGQIPDHNSTYGMRLFDNGLHVMAAALSVIHFGNHHHADLIGIAVQHFSGSARAACIRHP